MANFLKSKKARGYLNVFFSIGAAIIIAGALAKIQHWGGWLGWLLPIGMVSEAFTFLVMALLPTDEEYHWEKVYPHINLTEAEERKLTGGFKQKDLTLGSGTRSESPLEGMDKMLEEAEITPANLRLLGENFRKLDQTVSQMGDMSSAVAATDGFSRRAEEAATAMGEVSESYSNTAKSLDAFNSTASNSSEFRTELEAMTKNLSSLNVAYELELQDTDNHLKAMKKFYGDMAKVSETLSDGVEDSQKTKEQITLLAKNLEDLNAVYGNMLSAMRH